MIFDTNKDGTRYSVDRSLFKRGPWDNEHDRVEFRHAGLPCLMIRHPRSGVWCGYAGVAPGHPFHGLDFDDEKLVFFDAPGGITYAAECAGHICHAPREGEPEHVWWLGFDCNHAWDVEPRDPYGFNLEGCSYKTEEFVLDATKRLAESLAEASK